MKKETKKIIDELVHLHNRYTNTYRAIVTKERYDALVKSNVVKGLDYDSHLIREPLIEHVGHTALIASYLHRYIEHSKEVDLGRSLIMLSVHDIGETVVGDVMTYKKTKKDEDLELEQTRKLLPDYLYGYFMEMEERKTLDGKFAKSMDSIAPLIHEIVMPKVTLDRFEKYNFGIEDIIRKKEKHFEWDSVLKDCFDYLIELYRKM
jgi:5'-deoxynucleotidase YfbR-like HD superfamily hydrolase